MRPSDSRERRADRGSASAELVLISPLLIAILGLFFFAGRIVMARQAVDDAARTALEAAVTMPNPTGAATMAGITAFEVLAPDGQLCTHGSTTLNTTDYTAGGNVFVRVSCVVPLPRLAFAGTPASLTIAAVRGSVLEPYRVIQP